MLRCHYFSEQNGPVVANSLCGPLLMHIAPCSCTIPSSPFASSFAMPLSCRASSPSAFIMRWRLQAAATQAATAAAVRLTALAAAAAAAGIARTAAAAPALRRAPPIYCILMTEQRRSGASQWQPADTGVHGRQALQRGGGQTWLTACPPPSNPSRRAVFVRWRQWHRIPSTESPGRPLAQQSHHSYDGRRVHTP